MNARRTLLVVSLLWAAALTGCGYTLAGRGAFLPGHIKTIGIPPFDSMVPRSELINALTDAVTQEFISRGGFRIVASSAGADAVLDGTITGLVETPVAFDTDGRATQSQLVISARVTLRDVREREVVYENPSFQYRSDLELESEGVDFLDPESAGIEELAREFAKTLVATIVEGF